MAPIKKTAENMDKTGELRKKMIQRTQIRVKESLSKKESGAIKAATLIDYLDFAFNLLAEQTIDWYSYHFPELSRLVQNSETQLKLIYNIGDKKNYSEKNVTGQYNNPLKAKEISEAVKESLGIDLDEKELAEIKLLASNCLNLKEERKFLTAFLEKKMNSIAPNFSALCGPVLGAKFLAKAGSLKKLAFMTSTTLQVLGAQQALFSHLRSGTKPPKHGFLYAHPFVKQARPKQKGKAARFLAAKLSIAIKEDFFGDKKIFVQLKKELDKKVLQLNV